MISFKSIFQNIQLNTLKHSMGPKINKLFNFKEKATAEQVFQFFNTVFIKIFIGY